MRLSASLLLLSLLWFAQTACVRDHPMFECAVEGAAHLSGGESAGQVCRSFETRLKERLAARGKADLADDLEIALTIAKRGSAEARVVKRGAGGKQYPPIAVDVSDRALMAKDIDALADAVAQVVLAD